MYKRQVVVLIGVGGLLGFLANRRWGLGMALGAISVGAWQWVTAVSYTHLTLPTSDLV